MAEKVKKIRQRFPTVRWFGNNDTPIKKVAVGSTEIESIPQTDRGIVALATHALVESKIILMGVFVAVVSAVMLFVLGAFALASLCSAIGSGGIIEAGAFFLDVDLLATNGLCAAIAMAFTLIIGAFVMPRCHSVFKGFRTLSGETHVGLSRKYKRIIRDFCRLSLVWGCFIILIQSLVRKIRRGVFESPLLIAVPENCGLGKWIEINARKPKFKKQKPLKEPDEDEQQNNKNSLEGILIFAREGLDWKSNVVSRRRRAFDPFPDKKWFTANDTPIKEINIHAEVLNSMSEDELDLISVSSYALVKTRIKIISAFLWLVAIGLVIALPIGLPVLFLADTFSILIIGLLWFFGALVIGAVYMLPCNTMLEGFLYIDGVERLGLDKSYKKKIKAFSKISFVWGCLLIIIIAYMGGLKNGGVEYFLHVGIPQNCGYDKMIELYLAVEKASIDDVINALQQHSNESEYEKYKEKLDDLITVVKDDKQLTEKQKQELKDEIDGKRADAEKSYNTAQSELSEQHEQEIKPAYDYALQEATNDSIEYPYANYATQQLNEQIDEHIRNEIEDYIQPQTRPTSASAVAAYKRYALVNIVLPVLSLVLLFVSIIFLVFTALYVSFYLLLASGVFAIAAIVVNYITRARSNIKVASITLAISFVYDFVIVLVDILCYII